MFDDDFAAGDDQIGGCEFHRLLSCIPLQLVSPDTGAVCHENLHVAGGEHIPHFDVAGWVLFF